MKNVVTVSLEQEQLARLERIARMLPRHDHQRSGLIREALDIGLPVLEQRFLDERFGPKESA